MLIRDLAPPRIPAPSRLSLFRTSTGRSIGSCKQRVSLGWTYFPSSGGWIPTSSKPSQPSTPISEIAHRVAAEALFRHLPTTWPVVREAVRTDRLVPNAPVPSVRLRMAPLETFSE